MARALTVRDLRLHWPEAERRLRREGELVVTRDGQPVAKLVAYDEKAVKRPKWDAATHMSWLKRFWRGSVRRGPSTDAWLAKDRGE
jgi:antitoxin (DNA-binding transcriptional repressor) of toxin-antitoxin stability system